MHKVLKRTLFSTIIIQVSAIILAIIMFQANVTAVGNVNTVEDAFGNGESIYVAGNPDCYPIEYYNKDTKQFEGIMPTILRRVSEETGLSFTYIRGGEEDQRTRLVSNGQVELVTCVEKSEKVLIDSLKGKSEIVFTVKGAYGEESYFMGYSIVASQDLLQKINDVLKTVSSDDIMNISIEMANQYYRKDSFLNIFNIAAITVAILASIAVIVLSIVLHNKNKEDKESLPEENVLMTKESFIDHFDISLDESKRKGYAIAFISFDTDSMAKTYGISSINQHLDIASKELLNIKGLDDLLFIDNFGLVIARNTGSEESTKVWISNILRNLNGNTEHNSNWYYRAGVYLFKNGDVKCENAIIDAWQSFLEALRGGKDYLFSTQELINRISKSRQLVEDAKSGLINKEFKLYLQPIVETNTHKVIGAESLTRWEHPTRGLLHPGDFIQALMGTGTIHQLDYYIFEEVCSQLDEWKKQGINKDFFISCNFTRNTIDSDEFAAEVLSIAKKYDFDYSNVIFEITEDAFENNRAKALNNITICHDAGFKIAIDDLGTGSTSFTDLCDYPLDLIKIDMSILHKASTERGKLLLGAIINMGHELKLNTLCEGVETKEDVLLLESLNCCYMQGYYFSHPMPADIVVEDMDNIG